MAIVRDRRHLNLRLPLPEASERRPRFPLPPFLHHHDSHLSRCHHSHFRRRPRETPSTRPRERRDCLQSPPQPHLRNLRPKSNPRRQRSRLPPPGPPGSLHPPPHRLPPRHQVPRRLRHPRRRHRHLHGVHGHGHPRDVTQGRRRFHRTPPRQNLPPGTERSPVPPLPQDHSPRSEALKHTRRSEYGS
ncbi:UNVERIFIED_CONTAM: hypothetical protein Sradi_0590800 [Sesamum radiatum]|uniref:Uncharacterized protein n=1 Tax=Sesamum radiatum TaxID=300843 RepID=A0AAW2VKA6_SESRA